MDIEIEEKEEIEIQNDELKELVEKMNAEPLVSSSSLEWIKEETLVLIVKTKSEFSDVLLLGKKMADYVGIATSVCTQKFVDGEDKIFETLLKYAPSYKQIAVFYSDTPLLQKSTFFEIMQYFASKKMNFLPLKRGFVIKSDYIENFASLLSTPLDHFGRDDFYVVDDAISMSYAFKVLSKRIIDFQKSQGVVLFGENTIFIDADVQIESGVVIYPNNVIKGESVICRGVVLQSGNTIDSSIICDDAEVGHSYIKNSKVSEGKALYGANLINETI